MCFVLLSALLFACEQIEEALDELESSSINEDYIGSFTVGVGDLIEYSTGKEYNNCYTKVIVATNNDQYDIDYEISTNPAYGFGYEGSFRCTSGSVDYKSGSYHYVGTVNFGKSTNTGSIKKYKLTTDGGEELKYKITWNCSKKN